MEAEQDQSAPVTEASGSIGKLLETITSQEKTHGSHRRTDSGKHHESYNLKSVLQFSDNQKTKTYGVYVIRIVDYTHQYFSKISVFLKD